MLALRKETDYALQLLRLLSHSERSLSLNSAAERTGLSFLFLQKIARKLRLAKIIKAKRGISGGYKLAKPPRRLNLKQIVEAMEGPCALVECASCVEIVDCQAKDTCLIKKPATRLSRQISKLFEQTKLSDI